MPAAPAGKAPRAPLARTRLPPLLLLGPAALAAGPATPGANCTDRDERCERWGAAGECDGEHWKGVRGLCRKSCKLCDLSPRCGDLAAGGQCDDNPDIMWSTCYESCSKAVPKRCINTRQECWMQWLRGECLTNSRAMARDCGEACRVCGEGDPCLPDPGDGGLAPAPGDLGRLLARAQASAQLGPRLLSADPSLIVFEEFLSEAEADELLRVLADDSQSTQKFARSLTGGVGGAVAETARSVRTSSQRFCYDSHAEACGRDPRVVRLLERVEGVLGAARQNFEHLQVLRYEEGQYYREHDDFLPDGLNTRCGPRLLTLFVYLNTVPEGGETHFPRLGLNVSARKGRAVLWPDVLDSDPFAADERYKHESMPVGPGGVVKYAVNIWVHQYRYRLAPADEAHDCYNALRPLRTHQASAQRTSMAAAAGHPRTKGGPRLFTRARGLQLAFSSAASRLLSDELHPVVLWPEESGDASQNELLWAWMRERGAQVYEGMAPAPIGDGGLWGMKAMRSIERDVELLRVPAAMILPVDLDHESSPDVPADLLRSIPDNFPTGTQVASVQLSRLFDGSGDAEVRARWQPYLEKLRALGSWQQMPDFVDAFQQSPLRELALYQNRWAQASLDASGRDSRMWLNRSSYLHANWCLISRVHGTDNKDGRGLVPGGDLFNHQFHNNARWTYKQGPPGYFVVSAARAIEEGEEILVSYGEDKSNAEMMAHYGFTNAPYWEPAYSFELSSCLRRRPTAPCAPPASRSARGRRSSS
ncbi:unnamed protein product [Prorocentrum cordatum]|uniref:Procollagen-proline 4-dioxygenase n=1 Tax=Prorocentrum cordatum TaxID=2364126 RepID=A0ABN9WV38_9DINO|nr:unnamed protein product [Polarella glacialis]